DPLAAAPEPAWPLRPGSEAFRTPSRGAARSGAQLEPLAGRIMATLSAAEPSKVGTLREFADVIESGRMPLGRHGRSPIRRTAEAGRHPARRKLVEAS
ncbi:MAG TPA: hypothetical protein VFY39_05390, partial [Gammaproteobacteria bacterium]|nr:hypothetical protein [Gammaproteobacteria bacterium]